MEILRVTLNYTGKECRCRATSYECTDTGKSYTYTTHGNSKRLLKKTAFMKVESNTIDSPKYNGFYTICHAEDKKAAVALLRNHIIDKVKVDFKTMECIHANLSLLDKIQVQSLVHGE